MIDRRARRRGAIGVGRTPVPLGTAFAVMIVLLYLPIVLLAVFSFNASKTLSFPPSGFTFTWYSEVFKDSALLGAARNSIIVGGAAATAATALGLAVALTAVRSGFRLRGLLVGLAAAPLVVPLVAMGVAIFLLFTFLDVPRSLLTVAAGHSVVALPYATLILMARMVGLDPALEDAAMDLGATYPVTLRRVILPVIGPTLLSAWLTSFIVSFDEVAMANFLAGGDPTFPVFLYGQLRFAQRLPVLIAMAVLLMIGTVILTVIANRLRSRDG